MKVTLWMYASKIDTLPMLNQTLLHNEFKIRATNSRSCIQHTVEHRKKFLCFRNLLTWISRTFVITWIFFVKTECKIFVSSSHFLFSFLFMKYSDRKILKIKVSFPWASFSSNKFSLLLTVGEYFWYLNEKASGKSITQKVSTHLYCDARESLSTGFINGMRHEILRLQYQFYAQLGFTPRDRDSRNRSVK